MKRTVTIALCIILSLCVLTACGKPDGANRDIKALPAQVDPGEHKLYQDIFFNDKAGEYDGKEVTKKGILTVVYDAYNNVTRYYVWGYEDPEKCCDWQWELVPADEEAVKSIGKGSLVEVKGKFVSSEAALDGYYIENATVTVLEAYEAPEVDIDMTSMDGTLERIQAINIRAYPEQFEDKTVIVYGRIVSQGVLQHPYQDEAFMLEFETKDTVPEAGTKVIIRGTFKHGLITKSTVTETTQY